MSITPQRRHETTEPVGDDFETRALEDVFWAALPAGTLGADEVGRARDLLAGLSVGDLYVVALGEFKRGKSSLLNLLIGAPLLPVDVLPLTSVVTVVRRGESATTVAFRDGRTSAVDSDALPAYVTESGNPGNAKGVQRVEVQTLTLDLPGGAVLVDTPGLGSVYAQGTEVTLGFLPQVDVALLVLSGEQPLSDEEERLAVDLAEAGAQLVVALNKIDVLDGDEVERSLHFVDERLDALAIDAPVVPVSAKLALRGCDHDGVGRLRRLLSTILTEKRDDLFGRRVSRLLGAFLNEVGVTYAARRAVLERSDHELEELTAHLERLHLRLAAEADESKAIFDHRVQRARTGIAESGEAFRRHLEGRLLDGLAGLEEELRLRPHEAAVDRFLERTISADLQEAAARETARVGAELQEAANHFGRRLDQLGAELAQAVGELLDVRVEAPHPVATRITLPPIRLKLRDDQVALELISGGLTAAMPAAVRRRLLLRRARERALELANRHAGRLRSALTSALLEASRAAGGEVRAEFDRLGGSVEAATRCSRAKRLQEHAEATAELDRVRAVLEGVARLRQWLEDRPPGVARQTGEREAMADG